MNEEFRIYRLYDSRCAMSEGLICEVVARKGSTASLVALNELAFFQHIVVASGETARPVPTVAVFVMPDEQAAALLHIIAAMGDP